jgi:indolepyruvate ferredoxin oxidoreductase
MNIRAFRWGRLLVADRTRVDAVLQASAPAAAARPRLSAAVAAHAAQLIAQVNGGTSLRRALEVRVPELIAYQNTAYAARYIEQVRKIRSIEQAMGGEREELSIAVAKYYYKLLAVKDEYEVARLLLDEGERLRIKETFGDHAKVTWHLHPSLLRSLGVKNKVRLGAWFTPALRLLRWGRRVRGTALDVFGAARLRRAERALLKHYEALLESLRVKLTSSNYADAVKLAALPDMVRGYEDVKLRSIALYLAAARMQANQLGLPWPPDDGLVAASPAPTLAQA